MATQQPPKTGGPEEFTITCTKTALSSKIGLDIVRQDGIALKIKLVKEGLIRDWNRDNASREVLVGDCIVSVNGVSGNSDKLLETIAKDTTLVLQISRNGA